MVPIAHLTSGLMVPVRNTFNKWKEKYREKERKQGRKKEKYREKERKLGRKKEKYREKERKKNIERKERKKG